MCKLIRWEKIGTTLSVWVFGSAHIDASTVCKSLVQVFELKWASFMIKSWQPIYNSFVLFRFVFFFIILSHSTDTKPNAFRVSKCAHAFDLIVWIAPWEDTSISKQLKAKAFAFLLHLWVKIICLFFAFVFVSILFIIQETNKFFLCTEFEFSPT